MGGERGRRRGIIRIKELSIRNSL
jgi:hypothetical protein